MSSMSSMGMSSKLRAGLSYGYFFKNRVRERIKASKLVRLISIYAVVNAKVCRRNESEHHCNYSLP